ncbi:PucR family transcriptional regulator [Nocardia yunnanensis]|uniref:PucR family transcriptional regulator n=2 Tax=Nocardia yunnanensis TaxID=2382165 RepID=A0A386ZQ21_9NOCA|nr:PucR family transcriptional regulator [Nocardia yunnanensis]
MDELSEAITTDAPLDHLLATAVERLGLPPLALVSATGRLIAASAPGSDLGSRTTSVGVGPAPRSPFDGWWLRTDRAVGRGQQPVLDALAALLARAATAHRNRLDEQAAAAPVLFAALAAQDAQAISAIMRDFGLTVDGDLTPVVVRIPGVPAEWTVDAVHELLAGSTSQFLACATGTGEAIGITTAPARQLTETIPERLVTMRDLREGPSIAVGIGPAADPSTLAAALSRAHYAAGAAEQSPGTGARVRTASEMTSLDTLLEGLPVAVSQAFQAATIGPIVDYDTAKGARLLETLRTFLDNDASWTRTAAAMHLHVNTVHYRIERIEALTGRRVADPRGQLDLHAALMLYRHAAEGH